MKKWLILFSIPTLLSCQVMNTTNDNDENFYHKSVVQTGRIKSYDLPKHAINDVVKGLALQMIKSSDYVNPKTPIAVASFVNLEDLESTNWLGNQLAESFIHELQRHGYVVVDFKTTGYIRVTPEGDFVFSRDWKELPERQIIDYVVTGTMMKQENGVIVNARMIGMQSHVVVATAQSFIPAWVISKEISRDEKIKIRDGMIIRDQSELANEERAIKIHK
jgi:TolB-like protein